MPDQPIDLPQGTLDLLILRTLSFGPQHGWGISERVQQVSSDVLRIQQGSLYPALHRLEHQGWIEAEWGTSELGRRARFYRLNNAGRKQLELEADREGARLAGAAGFDRRAAVCALRRLAQTSTANVGLAAYFSSHPPFEDRIRALEQAVA